MAGHLKPLVKGALRRSFLGWGHALEWMLLGQVRGWPRINPLWPGQSLHMTWAPGPVGQGFRAGALCDIGFISGRGWFSGFAACRLGFLFEAIGFAFLAAGFLFSGLLSFLALLLLFL